MQRLYNSLFILIDVSTIIIAWLLPDWVETVCITDRFFVLHTDVF
ncbi:MAG: hypothetical protein RIE73_09630 [Coleofasciculus sp. C1-SOL-03]